MFCCVWHYESSDSGAHGVVVSHPLRMRKALSSIPACSLAGKRFLSSSCPLHRQRFSCAVCRPLSCLSVPLSAKGPGGQYTLENAGRDDLGGFSTPILLRCSCSKKCSKSSRPRFLSVGHVWPLLGCVPCLLPIWASQPANQQQHALLFLTLWEQWLRGTWCSGITSASHAEGPGLNPQCVHAQHAACYAAC